LAEGFGEGGDAIEFESLDGFIGTSFIEIRGVNAFERFGSREVGLRGSEF